VKRKKEWKMKWNRRPKNLGKILKMCKICIVGIPKREERITQQK
jgi:hypothetical protein